MSTKARNVGSWLSTAMSIGTLFSMVWYMHEHSSDARANRAELAAIQKHVQLVDALVAQNKTAFVAVDIEGKVTLWNAGAAAIFGWTEEEMLGQSIDRLMWPAGLAKHSRAVAAAFSSDDPHSVQVVRCRCKTKNGGSRDLLIRARVVESEGGEFAVASIDPLEAVQFYNVTPR